MNTKIIIYLLALLSLAACQDNEVTSDAYGKFEAREVIISAEASGKLIQFDVEEGQQLKAGELVGLIDTTLLHLQREQLRAKIRAVTGKTQDAEPQVRVLQERSYERVGSSVTNKTDVRVIAATHRRLEELIDEGKFREDLYYRLNVFPIEVPPLRERRDDIALLIDELIKRIENDHRGSVRLTRNAVAMLSLYDWPGNVRELANLIERLAILHPHNVVDVKDLPEKFISDSAELTSPPPPPEIDGEATEPAGAPSIPEGGIDMKQYLMNIEISLIEQALDETNNVVARAATLLRMRRTTLVEKMRKYEIVR